MRFSNWIFGYIFINAAAFLLVYPIPGVGPIIPIGREINLSPLDITNQFNLAVFAIGTGGTILASVIGVLLRQYVYAAGVLLIAVVGMFLPIIQWLVAGLPMMLAAILAPYDLSWLITTIVAFVTVHAFMFMIGLLGGRDIT